MTKAQIRKNVFLKSIPIMCSYIFVSMAYGIMMENAGFQNCDYHNLTGGIVAVHRGFKL